MNEPIANTERDPTEQEVFSATVALLRDWTGVRGSSLSIADIVTSAKTLYDGLLAVRTPGGKIPARRATTAPKVSAKASVTDEYLISLEDGKHYKTLRRHLGGLGMTPDEYRTKWGLPADYPMTAPSYSRMRSAMAKEIGLGLKR